MRGILRAPPIQNDSGFSAADRGTSRMILDFGGVMSIWSDRSCWASVWFDVETTAALTRLKPDTIYHYVSRHDRKFPQPATDRGRNYFSGEQVFRYILEHRRKAHSVVPRLFPRIARATIRPSSSTPNELACRRSAISPSTPGSPQTTASRSRSPTQTAKTPWTSAMCRHRSRPTNKMPPTTDRRGRCPERRNHLPYNTGPYRVRNAEPTVVVAERNPVYRRRPSQPGAAR